MIPPPHKVINFFINKNAKILTDEEHKDVYGE